jgi:hypothetical protein
VHKVSKRRYKTDLAQHKKKEMSTSSQERQSANLLKKEKGEV